MPRALLALGSNVGDRGAQLDAAVIELGTLPGTTLLAKSTWHATRPVGGPPGQGDFLNGAALIETSIEPAELGRMLQIIEQRLGRQRTERWAARSLDIDLLLYGDRVIDQPDLQVPHPRMSFRPFVLAPAAEIAADMLHPKIGVSVGELWDHLQHAEDAAVICGGRAEDRRRFLEALRLRFGSGSTTELKLPVSSQTTDFVGLRIVNGELALDSLPLSRAARKRPKLQIALRSMTEDASLVQWQLYNGIPTLTLDMRDDPADRVTEAAAALEAVWPDLGRNAP
jgi:2-amino-4-hydroxy-6-hydroxymethyldihydropteridine diphosphokinase